MDISSIAQCVHRAVPNMMIVRFNETLLEFLSNLKNTFPDYELQFTTATNELQLALRLGRPEVAMNMFSAVLGDDGLDKCIRHDEEFVFKLFSVIDFLKQFNVRDIWHQCPEDVRDHIWLYVIELASLVRSYNQAMKTTPEDVVRQVQGKDQQIEAMLTTGMAPMDILKALIAKK